MVDTKFLSVCSAILTFFSLISLLATVYLQQQTYKFIDSNRGIQNGLFVSSDLPAVTSLDMIWSWIDKIIENSAIATMNDINSNCYYPVNQQTILINGLNYTLYDPRHQIQSCTQNIFFIQSNGLQRKVQIKGNNQILSFGMFMKRSYPRESMKGAAGDSSPVVIATDETYQSPNAKYDPKFIEVCSVRQSSSVRCVLKDGLKGQPGSTLQWTGKEIERTRMAFDSNSRAFLYLKGSNYTLVPCYTTPSASSHAAEETIQRIRLDDNDTITWSYLRPSSSSADKESLVNCTVIWLTPGTTIRSKCLRVMNSQFTPRDSFMGAILGGQTVTSIYDLHFDCSRLIQYPLAQVRRWYYQSEDTIRVHITLPNQQRYYGNFFSSSDEFIWLGEGISLSTLLQFHEYLDTNTRLFKIFIVIRNLGDSELFYSLVTITFSISPTGSLTNSYNSVFIPIVQYYYGLDGYPWLFKDVAISELFLGLVLVMLLFKIALQVLTAVREGIVPWLKQHFAERQRRQRLESSSRSDQEISNRLVSFLESLWTNQSAGRVYLSPSKALPVFTHEEEITPASPPALGHERTSETREVEMSPRRLFPLVTDKLEEEPGLKVQTLPPPLDASPSPNTSPCRERNPLALRDSESFSSPLPPPLSNTQRRRSLLVDLAGESFKQVKLFVFVTWDLLLDLCATIVLLLMLFYRLKFIHSCKSFHDYITHLQGTDIDTSHAVEKIIRDFSFLQLYLAILKTIALAAVLLGISHFFLRTSQGKRLGIVTRTITKTLHDLIPLLFIFMTLLIAYATLGTEIYGARLDEWSNLFQSMGTLFIMILGNYDSYDQSESAFSFCTSPHISPVMIVDSTQTTIFFWSYVALIYFVVFNIALAVILEVYSDIRRENQSYFRLKKRTAEDLTSSHEWREEKGGEEKD
jgi:hypothetical protein